LVEGDGESILLPQLAKLLGRPLEDYGVSIITCDNSGSWKRFARLFLRKDTSSNHLPIKVCALRDLDLWPDCAEENDGNEYGFKDHKAKEKGKIGNEGYWLKNYSVEEIEQRRKDHKYGLERNNVKVLISNDWTLEYCLAKHGLFDECYEAINGNKDDIGNITGDVENKATYVQSKVSKTNFPYMLVDILERELSKDIETEKSGLTSDQDCEAEASAINRAERAFSIKLKNKLPSYIVEAIEHVTKPIEDEAAEVSDDVSL